MYPKDKLAKDVRISANRSGFSGVTMAHNVKTNEEVDAIVELAVSAGEKLVNKPQDVFWGGYSGYFSDHDGYLWEVAYNPFMDLT